MTHEMNADLNYYKFTILIIRFSEFIYNWNKKFIRMQKNVIVVFIPIKNVFAEAITMRGREITLDFHKLCGYFYFQIVILM